jgi:SHS family lactate transporter-like MFS transporter
MATLAEKPTEAHLEYENYHEPESKTSIGQYVATRVPTLIPPMTKVESPFKMLGLLNRQQWLFFMV